MTAPPPSTQSERSWPYSRRTALDVMRRPDLAHREILAFLRAGELVAAKLAELEAAIVFVPMRGAGPMIASRAVV